jgi:hypothetical protein
MDFKVKIAVAIGSYSMPAFIRLQILSLRKVFGEDVKILVSDDWSEKSVEIRDIADEMDVHHIVGGPRGHFAGDAACCCNGLAFAESEKADALIKVSQRFVLVEPCVRQILENYLADPETWLLLPGKISAATIKRAESRFFSNFQLNSDFLCIRSGTITPLQLKERYETRVRERQSRHATLIESLWCEMVDCHFNHHYKFVPELTHPYPGRPPIYLRRAQSQPADYQKLASELGLNNFLPLLQEWRQLTQFYRPVPQFQ